MLGVGLLDSVASPDADSVALRESVSETEYTALGDGVNVLVRANDADELFRGVGDAVPRVTLVDSDSDAESVADSGCVRLTVAVVVGDAEGPEPVGDAESLSVAECEALLERVRDEECVRPLDTVNDADKVCVLDADTSSVALAVADGDGVGGGVMVSVTVAEVEPESE